MTFTILIAPYSPFQKSETLESGHNWLLSNWCRLLNSEGPVVVPVLQIVQKIPEKYCPYIYQSAKYGDLMSCVSKDIFKKMHPIWWTNTHHNTPDLVNHEMVKNTKTWISWEQNISFPQNKKNILMCASDNKYWEVILVDRGLVHV